MRGSNRPSLSHPGWCRSGAERPRQEDGTWCHGAGHRRQSPRHRRPRILRRPRRRPRVAARLDPRRACAGAASVHTHPRTPARSLGHRIAATLVRHSFGVRRAAAAPVRPCDSLSSCSGYTEHLRRSLADAVFSRMVLRGHALHHRSMGLACPECRPRIQRQAA
jgi:hypothetical protein